MPHADVVVIGAGPRRPGRRDAPRRGGRGRHARRQGPREHALGLGRPRRRRARRVPRTPAEGVARLAAPGASRTASSRPTWPRRSPGCSSASRRAACPYAGTLDTPDPARAHGDRRHAPRRDRPRRAGRGPASVGAATSCSSSPGPPGSRTSGRRRSRAASGASAVWMGADRPGPRRRRRGGAGRASGTATTSTRSDLARRFDDPDAAGRGHRAVRGARSRRPPAGGPAASRCRRSFGLDRHAEAWAELRARLPLEPFEVPLVPPSIPGIRLWRRPARAHPRRRRPRAGRRGRRPDPRRGRPRDGRRDGGRDADAPRSGPRRSCSPPAASPAAGSWPPATAASSSRCSASTSTAPSTRRGSSGDALDPAGHPIEAAGIATDAGLRPLDPDGRRVASPTCSSPGRCSPSSARSASAAATASPSPVRLARRQRAGRRRDPDPHRHREPLAARTDQ